MNRKFLTVILSIIFGAFLFTQAMAQKSDESSKFVEETVKIQTPDADIYGTLLLPSLKKKVPIVLIISGSGPTDRDGNSPLFKGANNSLKMLAEGLAANGIASLRYDKRGIGETGKQMVLAAQKNGKILRAEDLTFDLYIDDAVSLGKHLRSDKRFSKLTVLGHSEGSLIGMLAARKLAIDNFISVAGPGYPAGQVILGQIKTQLTPELFSQAEEIVNSLIKGQQPSTVPSALNNVFYSSIQPYLISWFRFDPAKEIAALKIPILIVQGTTDMQVKVTDAKQLSKAVPQAQLLIVEGMNHVLKSISDEPQKQQISYGDPTLRVAPELINEISRFVKKDK